MSATNASTSRPRLLAVGQGAHDTGFSRVLNSVLSGLRDRYEIHHFALDERGPRRESPWTVHPNELAADPYGLDQLGPLVERVRPHLVFLLEDLCFFPLHLGILSRYRESLGIVLYVPIEDGQVPPEMTESLGGADRIVAYTRFGRAALRTAAARFRRQRPGFPFPDVGVMPHGVDFRRFHPLPAGRRALARQALGLGGPGDFLVLNANRNRPRKRLDLTLQGFALFAAGKPEGVRLCLHTERRGFGSDLQKQAEALGIAGRVLFTGEGSAHPGIGDDRLNLLYNACDVGINTADSEGWGLVSFEHAATGAAQIVPDHSVFRELWQGAASLVETRVTLRARDGEPLERRVTPEGIAAALEALYMDREHRRAMSEAAYRSATRPGYSWSRIAARWDRLFTGVLEGAA